MGAANECRYGVGMRHEVECDPRASRRDTLANSAPLVEADLVTSPFRADRDRINSSPFFARLGGVTQVVSAGGSGLLHNRLTHSLKVAQVARVIAERLREAPDTAELAIKLGGLDPDVTEAASLAHDLGHPPFGHLGERVLDRIAREHFGLVDGFEGNAQTFRILTTTDVRGPSAVGLDLTAAVRASVLKYPWLRLNRPQPHPGSMPIPPRGAAEPSYAEGTGASKFSVYSTELDDFTQSRIPFTSRVEQWQQTVEASVMDTADDIAYAIHDLQDFHRIGVLQHASVAAEFSAWLERFAELSTMDSEILERERGRPGHSLERLRRRLHAKDSWIVDDDAFVQAIGRVRTELVEDLLAEPFDGSIEAEQKLAAFSARWTARLVAGVVLLSSPSTRSGHVSLRPAQWHEVQVLKFVHKRFVLLRPDLALHQRGQASLVSTLVEALDAWLVDRSEAYRLPRRLRDLVELAYAEYSDLYRTAPELLVRSDSEPISGMNAVRSLSRGRAVVDFVSSLTDKQAVNLLDALSGRAAQPWSESFIL
jgi:dGTPase